MIIIEPPTSPLKGRPPFTKRDLERFLAQAKEAVPLRGAVTVLITSDDAIRDLNRRFRHKNKATDVLSFRAEDISRPGDGPRRVGASRVAGDLAISRDTALRQAQVFGHELIVELKVLILHGLLHLAGLDHEADSGEMSARESELRSELGLPAGLIQRTRSERGAEANSSRSRRTGKSSISKPLKEIGKLPSVIPLRRAAAL